MPPEKKLAPDETIARLFDLRAKGSDGVTEADVRAGLSVVRAYPDDPEAWNMLGDLAQLRNVLHDLPRDLPAPESCYERAIALDPGFPEPRVSLGYLRDLHEDFDGAASSLRAAIEAGGDEWAYALLARVEAQRGDRAAARRALDEGDAAHPGSEVLARYRLEIEDGDWDPIA